MKLEGINLNKYIDYIYAKVKQLLNEKTFGNKFPIKYMLYKSESPYLIVVFSACPRPGLKARYNYMKTIRGINANKLFILDEYGEDGRGCYYLGHNNDYTIMDNTKELIRKVRKELQIKQTIYLGSSKGGWASIFFGLDDEDAIIISGAPQYLAGTYFLNVPEIRIEEYVLGKEYQEKDIEFLDNLIRNKIQNIKEPTQKVYLNYSINDHTYKENICFLIEDLKENGFKLEEEVNYYVDHQDISRYFPQFIITTLKKIIKK